MACESVPQGPVFEGTDISGTWYNQVTGGVLVLYTAKSYFDYGTFSLEEFGNSQEPTSFFGKWKARNSNSNPSRKLMVWYDVFIKTTFGSWIRVDLDGSYPMDYLDTGDISIGNAIYTRDRNATIRKH